MRWYWIQRCRLDEGREVSLQALVADPRPSVARGRLLSAVSALENAKGLFEPARAHAMEGIEVLRREGELSGLANGLSCLSAVLQVGYREHEQGLRIAEEGASVARAARDDLALGNTLNDIGLARIALGGPGEARIALEEAAARVRGTGNASALEAILESLAHATLDDGDHRLAAGLWAESLRSAVSLGHRQNATSCLTGFSRIAAEPDPARALRLAAGAAAVRRGDDWAMPGWEAEAVDTSLDEAWRRLPDEVAKAALREAAAMDLEQLAAYALAEPLLRSAQGEPEGG
jgi:hypothetical protein